MALCIPFPLWRRTSRVYQDHLTCLESPTNKDGVKKKIHQFDRMYLFEDINFSTQEEEETIFSTKKTNYTREVNIMEKVFGIIVILIVAFYLLTFITAWI